MRKTKHKPHLSYEAGLWWCDSYGIQNLTLPEIVTGWGDTILDAYESWSEQLIDAIHP